jgi:integrating conjugative element membrane protein (TIGR03745 family)
VRSIKSRFQLNKEFSMRAKKWMQDRYRGVLLAGAALTVTPVFAALPAPVAPSTGPAAGDWLGLIKGYAKDAGLVLGLIVAVAGFVWVSYAAIAKFNEARTGKAEWAEVGLLSVAAGGVLILASYLLGTAAGVI